MIYNNKYLKLIKEFIFIVLPKSKYDYIVLFFSFLLYYPIGVFLTLTTKIIDDEGVVDMYYGFDNSICLKYGFMFEVTHPMTGIFYYPIRYINFLIEAYGINHKIYTLVVVFLCAFFVSFSNLFVFKYLTRVLNLKMKESLIIIFPYVFCTGNLILSFTPETFTFSMFLLSLNLYVVSYYISKNRSISLFYYVFMGSVIGGQTITNSPKAVLAILFERKFNFKNLILSIKKIILATLLITMIILASLKFEINNFLEVNAARAKMFAFIDNHSVYDCFISQFFGGNILFPPVYISKTNAWQNSPEGGIYSHFYDSWDQYLFIYIIIALIIISIIKNYKSRLIWIPIISFCIDFFYHMILRLGLPESLIYGGHFIFVVPVILGWLFYNKKSTKNYNILCLGLTILGIYLIINNIFEIVEFIRLAQIRYPIN